MATQNKKPESGKIVYFLPQQKQKTDTARAHKIRHVALVAFAWVATWMIIYWILSYFASS